MPRAVGSWTLGRSKTVPSGEFGQHRCPHQLFVGNVTLTATVEPQFRHSRSPIHDPSCPRGVFESAIPFPPPSGKAGLSAFPPVAEKGRFPPVTGVDIQAKTQPGVYVQPRSPVVRTAIWAPAPTLRPGPEGGTADVPRLAEAAHLRRLAAAVRGGHANPGLLRRLAHGVPREQRPVQPLVLGRRTRRRYLNRPFFMSSPLAGAGRRWERPPWRAAGA